MMRGAVTRSSYGGVANCNTLSISSFVNDVMFSHNGLMKQPQSTKVGHKLKVIHQRQWHLDNVQCTIHTPEGAPGGVWCIRLSYLRIIFILWSKRQDVTCG